MARVAPLLPTFAKGEISPLVVGRVDTEQYVSSLDKCRNCIIRPYGLVMRRVGTEYITSTKNNGVAKLIKFVFSNTDAYMIEMGAGYFRFYTNGGAVIKTLADTDAWLTATNYVVGDFVKESSIIYYCIEDHTSGTFATDLAADKWVAQDIYELPNEYTEDQLDLIQYAQIDDVIKLVAPTTDTSTDMYPKELIRFSSNEWTFTDVDFICTPFLDDNLTTTTITPSATTGTITLTASTSIFESGHIGSFWKIGGTTGTPSLQGYVQITAYSSGTSVTAVVQSTLSGTGATTDWAEGAFSDVRGYPSCISLFSGRLYYARTTYEPRGVWGSRPYAYESFLPAVDNEDDGAIDIELGATGDSNDIKMLASGLALVVGTYGGEFVVTAGDGGTAITPSSVTASKRTSWGSEQIQPINLGSFIYYMQRGARKLREFYYLNDYQTYKSVDMSILSEHITESGLKDIAYQQNPDSVIWGCRNDGKITAFCREVDQEVAAWSLIDTDGLYESVEILPSYDGYYDETWYIVNRTIDGQTKRYIERSQNPITPEIQEECFYVDCGLTYDAYSITDGNNLTLSALTGSITITSDSSIFSASDVGYRIRAIDSNKNILGQAKITAYTSDTEVTATVIKDFDSLTYTGGYWGLSVKELTNLDHLEGKTVQILADGGVVPPEIVDSGSLTLDIDGWYINVGLHYQSYIKTLPIDAGSQNGTSIGKRKRINELSLRVWRSLGMSVGYDLDNLQNIIYRQANTEMGLPEEFITDIITNIKYNQGWVWSNSITISQEEPLPMNILQIAPIMTEVDK
jgi:hypothetical protein